MIAWLNTSLDPTFLRTIIYFSWVLCFVTKR